MIWKTWSSYNIASHPFIFPWHFFNVLFLSNRTIGKTISLWIVVIYTLIKHFMSQYCPKNLNDSYPYRRFFLIFFNNSNLNNQFRFTLTRPWHLIFLCVFFSLGNIKIKLSIQISNPLRIKKNFQDKLRVKKSFKKKEKRPTVAFAFFFLLYFFYSALI